MPERPHSGPHVPEENPGMDPGEHITDAPPDEWERERTYGRTVHPDDLTASRHKMRYNVRVHGWTFDHNTRLWYPPDAPAGTEGLTLPGAYLSTYRGMVEFVADAPNRRARQAARAKHASKTEG